MMRPHLHQGQLFEENSTLRGPHYDVGKTHTHTHTPLIQNMRSKIVRRGFAHHSANGWFRISSLQVGKSGSVLRRDDHDDVGVGALRLQRLFRMILSPLQINQDRRNLFPLVLLHPPLAPLSPTDRLTLLIGEGETAVKMPRFTALRVRKRSVLKTCWKPYLQASRTPET